MVAGAAMPAPELAVAGSCGADAASGDALGLGVRSIAGVTTSDPPARCEVALTATADPIASNSMAAALATNAWTRRT